MIKKSWRYDDMFIALWASTIFLIKNHPKHLIWLLLIWAEISIRECVDMCDLQAFINQVTLLNSSVEKYAQSCGKIWGKSCLFRMQQRSAVMYVSRPAKPTESSSNAGRRWEI